MDFHRGGARDTSIAAAIKAVRASADCTWLVDALMSDGIGRNDYEIYLALRAGGYIKDAGTIRHGRLALERASVFRDSGMRRKPPKEGDGWGDSIVWVQQEYQDVPRGMQVAHRLPTRVTVRLTPAEAEVLASFCEEMKTTPSQIAYELVKARLDSFRNNDSSTVPMDLSSDSS